MQTSLKRAINKFLKEIEVDENFWNAWVSSEACSLNTDDLIIIKGFILTGNHKYSCNALHISNLRAEQSFESSKEKIIWSYEVYRNWLTNILLEEFEGLNKSRSNCFPFPLLEK